MWLNLELSKHSIMTDPQYYNETYPPLPEQYDLEGAQVAPETRNISNTSSQEERTIVSHPSRPNRAISRMDSSGLYSLPNVEDDSPSNVTPGNRIQHAGSTTSLAKGSADKRKKVCSWKWGAITSTVLGLMLVTGTVTYFLTNPNGNINNLYFPHLIREKFFDHLFNIF